MQRLSSVVKEKVEAYVVSGVQEERKIELLDNLSIAVEKIQNKFENPIHNKVVKDGKEVETLCSCLEDIFNHGLREKIFQSSSKNSETLSFWAVVQKLSMKEDVQSIYRLSIVQTDINRCRAWIRMKLKDHTIGSYIGLLTENSKLLKEHYNSNAFLRDAVKTESVRTLLQYVIASLDFYINVESSSRFSEPAYLDGRLSADSPRPDLQQGEILRTRRSSKRRTRTLIANIASMGESDCLSTISSDRSSDQSSSRSSIISPNSPYSETANGVIRKPSTEIALESNSNVPEYRRASDGQVVDGTLENKKLVQSSLSVDSSGRDSELTTRLQRSGSSCSSKSRSSNGSLKDRSFNSSLSQEVASALKAKHEGFLCFSDKTDHTKGKETVSQLKYSKLASPSRRALAQKQKEELAEMMRTLRMKSNKPLTTEKILEMIPMQKEMTREEMKQYIDECLWDYFSMGIISTKGVTQNSPGWKPIVNSELDDGNKINNALENLRASPKPAEVEKSGNLKHVSLDEFLSRGRTGPPYWSSVNADIGKQSKANKPESEQEVNVVSGNEIDNSDKLKVKPGQCQGLHQDTLKEDVMDHARDGTQDQKIQESKCPAVQALTCSDADEVQVYGVIHNLHNDSDNAEIEGTTSISDKTSENSINTGAVSESPKNDEISYQLSSSLRNKIFLSDTSAFEKPVHISNTVEVNAVEVSEVIDAKSAKLETNDSMFGVDNESSPATGKELAGYLESSIKDSGPILLEDTEELNFVPGIHEESSTPKHSKAKPIVRSRKANTIGPSRSRPAVSSTPKGTKSLERDTPSKLKLRGASSVEATDLLYGFRVNSPILDSTRSSIDTNQGYLFDDDDYISDSEADTFTSDENSERERIRSLLADLGVNDDIIGMKEDHFATPDSFMGFTSDEELENAIETCKERVKSLSADSEERKHLVRKLVQLRLKQHELKEAPSDDVVHVKKILGHHFTKQGKVPGNYFCDSCGSTIWALMHTLYKCQDCSFHCHRRCLKSIDKPCVSNKVSGSVYITDITPESGLATQQYRCADCRRRLTFRGGFFQARICDYTGQFYCSNCHWNETQIIPARIIHNWDFVPRKISRQSKHLLNLLSAKPMICLKEMNPALFNFVEDLRDVRALREQVLNMKKYLVSCRIAVEERLLLLLKDRQHFVENSDMYTMQDLMTIYNGKLLEELSRLTALFGKHIKFDCPICQGRGFICELCPTADVIFPFDFNSTTCQGCHSLFHRSCYRKGNCPKCKRIAERKSATESKIPMAH